MSKNKKPIKIENGVEVYGFDDNGKPLDADGKVIHKLVKIGKGPPAVPDVKAQREAKEYRERFELRQEQPTPYPVPDNDFDEGPTVRKPRVPTMEKILAELVKIRQLLENTE